RVQRVTQSADPALVKSVEQSRIDTGPVVNRHGPSLLPMRKRIPTVLLYPRASSSIDGSSFCFPAWAVLRGERARIDSEQSQQRRDQQCCAANGEGEDDLADETGRRNECQLGRHGHDGGGRA